MTTTTPTAIAPELLDRDHWTPEEQANARLVAEFVQLLMNDHDLEAVRERFSDGAYTQHNRTMTDGLEGVLAYVGRTAKRYPEFGYDVRRVLADGDHVVIHSHVTLKAGHRGNDRKGLNITDTWRVVDGRLVEHWDSVEPIDLPMRLLGLLTGGRFRNTNGVF
ncbi:MAG: nuclear transport factor 2 family protein [Actinomycetota bacterium]